MEPHPHIMFTPGRDSEGMSGFRAGNPVEEREV